MSAQRRTATAGRRTRGSRGASARRGAGNAAAVQGSGTGVPVGTADPSVASSTSPVGPAPVERGSTAPKAAKTTQEKRNRQAAEQLTGWRLLLFKLRRWYNDTRAELRRVTWPDRDTTRNLTFVVIAVATFLGILLGGIDYLLFQLFEVLT